MDIVSAVSLAKNGKRIRRKCWPAKDFLEIKGDHLYFYSYGIVSSNHAHGFSLDEVGADDWLMLNEDKA